MDNSSDSDNSSHKTTKGANTEAAKNIPNTYKNFAKENFNTTINQRIKHITRKVSHLK